MKTHSHHLKVATSIANLMDNKFNFLGFKFGLDPLIGLIPGIGDVFPFVLGVYMVWIGVKMNIPTGKLGEMIRNIVIDMTLGIIPVVGDLSDFVFRAHHKNLLILEHYAQNNVTVIEGEIID